MWSLATILLNFLTHLLLCEHQSKKGPRLFYCAPRRIIHFTDFFCFSIYSFVLVIQSVNLPSSPLSQSWQPPSISPCLNLFRGHRGLMRVRYIFIIPGIRSLYREWTFRSPLLATKWPVSFVTWVTDSRSLYRSSC